MVHPTHSLFVYVPSPGAISSCRPIIHPLAQLTLSLFRTADGWTPTVISLLLIRPEPDSSPCAATTHARLPQGPLTSYPCVMTAWAHALGHSQSSVAPDRARADPCAIAVATCAPNYRPACASGHLPVPYKEEAKPFRVSQLPRQLALHRRVSAACRPPSTSGQHQHTCLCICVGACAERTYALHL
jgi:hypothetical protein